MQVNKATYNLQTKNIDNFVQKKAQQPTSVQNLVMQIGQKTILPDKTRNYSIFNTELVNKLVSEKETALPYIENFLKTANDEKQITEGLYVLDRMIDNKVKGTENLFPVISRFNDTQSPNVQVMLSGIYRKTKPPEAFGPLTKMMLKQTFSPNSPFFDPTEEIGGAILEYLKAQNAQNTYSNQSETNMLKIVSHA